MKNYYTDLPEYISNSELGRLEDILYCRVKMAGLQAIYDEGNLLDSMVTEKEKFDASTNTMTDNGRQIVFSDQKVDQYLLMQQAVESDPMFKLLMEDSVFQHVILRKAHPIVWNEHRFTLPMRAKFDLYRKREMVIDLKTTGCTTLEQFIASIFFFNYDRQGAVYIDLARVDRILYVGVSKKKNKRTGKHDVFKFMIKRGDNTYLSGLKKYSRAAFKYENYIRHLDTSKLVINL